MSDFITLGLLSFIFILLFRLVIVEWRWRIFSLKMKLQRRDIWIITKMDIATIVFAAIFVLAVLGFGIWGLVNSM